MVENADTTFIVNKLITYKTYGNLRKELVREIQEGLINNKKISEFEDLLKKVELEINHQHF